jgi:uncharacterized membrane protein
MPSDNTSDSPHHDSSDQPTRTHPRDRALRHDSAPRSTSRRLEQLLLDFVVGISFCLCLFATVLFAVWIVPVVFALSPLELVAFALALTLTAFVGTTLL